MMRLFAVAAPGLEATVAAEVRALPGARDVTEVAGGVEWTGGRDVVWRANLRLRVATRVLVRLGEVRARDFAKLRAGAAKLPWRDVAAARPRVEVSASARRCRLYHTGAIAERVEGAVADAFGGTAAAADAPALDVLVRGEDDRFVVSVDSSGELLHRRGWRVDTARASLRETLAAGLLDLAGWTPAEPLVDPMCGAGTIVIEAALAALGRAPGAARGFAFEAFAGFDRAAFEAVRAEPLAPAAAPLPLLLGNERDPATLALARRNAERAAVAGQVTLVEGDAARLELPATPRPGLILCNPPYGKRVSAGPGGAALAALAQLARRHPGWRLGVLLPDDRAALRALALRPPRARHALDNGGLRVWLNLW
jgi:putative N6-adenine-specific DNA methylase